MIYSVRWARTGLGWGIRVNADAEVQPGSVLEVVNASGVSKRVKVTRVLWFRTGVSLCCVEETDEEVTKLP